MIESPASPDVAPIPAGPDPFERYRHIVVEGPLGAGKTTLCHRLAQRFDVHMVLEAPEENPFLERFYKDSARYALPTQLSFLFQRVNQLRELTQQEIFTKPILGDFLLQKDPLFARLTLADDELLLYEKIYASLQPQAPTPDLVIYLQAPEERLMDRVRTRGRAMESVISDDYLRALGEAYSRFFHHYDDSPVLIVNTAHLNPVDNDEDLVLLIDSMLAMRGRKEFINLRR